MIKIQIASKSAALRAGIRVLLGSDPDLVFGDDLAGPEWLERIASDDTIWVCLQDDLDWLGEFPEGLRGLLIIGDSPVYPSRIENFTRTAWGIIPLSTSDEEFQEAIHAIYQGLVVMSPNFALQIMTQRSEKNNPSEKSGLVETLTEREVQILGHISQGLQNKQIGLALGISENTVKFHISSIYSKLEVSNRAEAVRKGARMGLVPI